jgi:hypothetical protein
LKPGRHVHAVAINVVSIDDDVAKVDANPVLDPLFIGLRGAQLRHFGLDLDGPIYGVDDTRELGQQTVPHKLHDATAVLTDLGLDQCFEAGPEASVGADLVPLHEACIRHHIRADDRGEPPLHHSFGHGGLLPVFGLDGAIIRQGGEGVQETTQGLVRLYSKPVAPVTHSPWHSPQKER